jgi:hypothetical protein
VAESGASLDLGWSIRLDGVEGRDGPVRRDGRAHDAAVLPDGAP